MVEYYIILVRNNITSVVCKTAMFSLPPPLLRNPKNRTKD